MFRPWTPNHNLIIMQETQNVVESGLKIEEAGIPVCADCNGASCSECKGDQLPGQDGVKVPLERTKKPRSAQQIAANSANLAKARAAKAAKAAEHARLAAELQEGDEDGRGRFTNGVIPDGLSIGMKKESTTKLSRATNRPAGAGKRKQDETNQQDINHINQTVPVYTQVAQPQFY